VSGSMLPERSAKCDESKDERQYNGEPIDLIHVSVPYASQCTSVLAERWTGQNALA